MALPPNDAGKIPIRHAFRMTLEHPEVHGEDLFRVSRDFDFHEVDDNAPAGRPSLVIDPVMVRPAQTVLLVTPTKAVPYAQIAAEIMALLDEIGTPIFGEAPRITQLEWLIKHTGEDSQAAATMGRIT